MIRIDLDPHSPVVSPIETKSIMDVAEWLPSKYAADFFLEVVYLAAMHPKIYMGPYHNVTPDTVDSTFSGKMFLFLPL